MAEERDKKPIHDRKYVDIVGNNLARSRESHKKNFNEGEVLIFLGYQDENGKKEVIYIPGTNANPQFKEKVCEAAMDLLISDSDISLFENYNNI
jgi:hypothetical protein